MMFRNKLELLWCNWFLEFFQLSISLLNNNVTLLRLNKLEPQLPKDALAENGLVSVMKKYWKCLKFTRR